MYLTCVHVCQYVYVRTCVYMVCSCILRLGLNVCLDSKRWVEKNIRANPGEMLVPPSP